MIAFADELGWLTLAALGVIGAAAYRWWKVSKAARGAGPGDFVTVADVRQMLLRGETPTLVDVRSESAFNGSATTAAGAVRLHPARAVEEAKLQGLPAEASLIVFCA